MKDYYSKYYYYEIIKRMNLVSYNRFELMLQYSKNYIKRKFDYFYILTKNKNTYDNSTYQNIKDLPNKIIKIISKKLKQDKDILYHNISYLSFFIDNFIENNIDEYMNKYLCQMN